jgi:hypothetical protein
MACSSAGTDYEIEVVSLKAYLVSGGDALVRVHAPEGTVITLNGNSGRIGGSPVELGEFRGCLAINTCNDSGLYPAEPRTPERGLCQPCDGQLIGSQSVTGTN